VISDADAAELIERQRRYREAQAEADRIVEPERIRYYDWLLHLKDEGATQREIADLSVPRVDRSRVQQLLQQARRRIMRERA